MVRQAAWIRSLMATYVKSTHGTRIGGLFGGRPDKEVLPWNGAQQAAFLILMGQRVRDAVEECDYSWAQILREEAGEDEDEEAQAFYGASSLMNTDQGIRGLLSVTNDLCYVLADELQLEGWFSSTSSGADDQYSVNAELDKLQVQPVAQFLGELGVELAKFDWRTSSAGRLSEDERILKSAYRGSGGYRELRRQLISHLRSGTGRVADAATEVYDLMRYDEG